MKVNSNFNTLEEVRYSTGPISFDGLDDSVFFNREAIQQRRGRIYFFVMGKYVGGSNSFDRGQPRGNYLNWDTVLELANYLGAEVGYHSFSHRDLRQLTDLELWHEVMPPFPMRYFAYPYGAFNQRVIEAVKAAGYEDAWTVQDGDGSIYQRKRSYL